MGYYENIIKLDEMRKKLNDEDYVTAQKILDTMELKKIKNPSDINLIVEVFSRNGRYEEAMEMLLKIYNKTKSRKGLYDLIWISIKLNNIEDAEHFLEEYNSLSRQQDSNSYIFRYLIDKMKKESFEVLIKSLEELKEQDYIEQWAYELAKLYYKAGMEDKCIKECSDLILFFAEGVYVEKAKVLKSYFLGETNKDKIIEELKRRARVSFSEPIDEIPKENSENEAPIEDESEQVIINDENSNMDNEIEIKAEEFSDNVIENRNREESLGLYNVEIELEPDINKIQDEDWLDKATLEYNIDLKQLLGCYSKEKVLKTQLSHTLSKLHLENSNCKVLIMTGLDRSEKVKLTKALSAILYKTGQLKSSKVARISADKLNRIEISEKKEVLKDCCIAIENASRLKINTIEKIIQFIRELQGDIAVVFEEENHVSMNALCQLKPELAEIFQLRIELE